MRHRVAGWKLGRNTSHRRALLRNLVTSLIMAERMITIGKKGGVANRRLAAAYLLIPEAVDKLFNTVGPRFGDRNGGYTRIVLTGFRKGDGGAKAFIEILGSEKVVDEKREKRAELRAKRAEETRKAMEEAHAEQQTPPAEGGEGPPTA